jgi:regulator of sirC expression with transglutaminase-like and TPR domain
MTPDSRSNSDLDPELAALMALLDDDSETVLDAVSARLSDLGSPATAALEELARKGAPRQRARAREILLRQARPAALATLASFAAEPIRDLEEGALLLAELAAPGVDMPRVRRRLDELAASMASGVEGAYAGEGRLRAFLHALHRVHRFRGDRVDYEGLANAFLPGVLERRRGIPITLAMIYLLVGRRLNLDFEILGLPRHAIARYREKRFTGFVDAYDGGQIWGQGKVLAFLAAQGYQGAAARPFLRPLTPRQILARMARNAESYAANRGLSEESGLFSVARQHLEIYETRDEVSEESEHD